MVNIIIFDNIFHVVGEGTKSVTNPKRQRKLKDVKFVDMSEYAVLTIFI